MTGGNQYQPEAGAEAAYAGWSEEFTLKGFSDRELSFKGRLFSEGAFFDEQKSSLTRMRLFAMEDKRLVYYVASGNGDSKETRVYVLTVEGDICHIDNGRQQISLPVDLLFTAVFGLCGLEEGCEGSLRAAFNEGLRAVAS